MKVGACVLENSCSKTLSLKYRLKKISFKMARCYQPEGVKNWLKIDILGQVFHLMSTVFSL